MLAARQTSVRQLLWEFLALEIILAAKYHISISLEDKEILAVTMEFSISYRNITFASKNYISTYFGWLRPVQTSSSQFGLV